MKNEVKSSGKIMANNNESLLAERDPEELFCLKWNDFTDNVMATMSDIRQDEDFFDVTLAIDGRQLRAHKLILSACSFFFRKLLRTNPAPNPVIVLWDVTFDDMLNILDFMYNGEVRVKQANIQNFLAVAEKFRVRGLCQNESSGQPSRSNTPQPKSPTSTGSSIPSRKRQKRDSGSITEPEVAIKDFAKNLKDESDITSSSNAAAMAAAATNPVAALAAAAAAAAQAQQSLETKHEPHDDLEDSSNASMPDNNKNSASSGGAGGNLNPGFLGMAAATASLMDPSAAKEFWRHFGLNPAMMAAAGTSSQALNINNGPGGSPGAVSGDGSGLRKPRSVYTSEQIGHLENFFRVNEYIDGERKRKLSQLTNIPEHQIKVWFQNRRQKKKREAEAAEQQMYGISSASSTGSQLHQFSQNIGSIDPGELSS